MWAVFWPLQDLECDKVAWLVKYTVNSSSIYESADVILCEPIKLLLKHNYVYVHHMSVIHLM